MASLRVVRGRLSASSEGEVKQKVASWAWWRLIDENGNDVMIKNPRALEFMQSHVIQNEEGTFVFTNEAAPWFLAFKYAGDGHVANGWKEWKDRRAQYPSAILLGLLMIAPVLVAYKFDWQTAGAWLAIPALLGVLGAFAGAVGTLGNLLSRNPSKQQVEAALNGD